MYKYLKYVVICFFIILAGGLLWLQNNARFHAYIAEQIKTGYEQATECDFDFKVKNINILGPDIVLEQVSARPKQLSSQTWQWQCDTCTINFSWIGLLLYGSVGLNLTLDNLYASSHLSRGILTIINEHVAGLLSGPAMAIPLYLKTIAFNNGTTLIKIPDIASDVTVRWSSESKKIDEIFKTNIYVKDGSVTTKERALVKNLAGTVYMDIASNDAGMQLKVRPNCTGDLQFLPSGKQFAFIDGSFEGDHGVFAIRTPEQICTIKDITVSTKNGFSVEAQAEMPIKTACALLDVTPLPIEGQCNAQLHVKNTAESYALDATVELGPVSYNSIQVSDSMKFDVHRDSAQWHGSAYAMWGQRFTLDGTWQFNEQSGKGSADLTNAQVWIVPYILSWNIAPHNAAVHVDFDSAYHAHVQYQAAMINPLTTAAVSAKGDVFINRNSISLNGSIGDSTYNFELPLFPQAYLKKLHFNNAEGEPLIALNSKNEDPHKFEGMFKIPLIRTLVRSFTNYDLQGEGVLNFQGAFALPQVQLKTTLAGATIRLPQTHNFISDFMADIVIDVAQKKVTAQNMECKMHRGSVKAGSAYALFDDAYNFKSFSLPVTLNSCLLNVKKDVFAMVSGALTLNKEENKMPLLQGIITIDRSLINENLFSDKVQKAIFSGTSSMFDTSVQDLLFDVTVETKNPIRVNTAFVEAQAKIKLHIQDSLQNPKVTGAIDLIAGSLAFPYRPLNIVRGNIFFMPNQLYDPMVELVARNTIKKHTVTLQVTGSLLNPHVTLESNPPLSEEQIVGLLLVGNQADSLNMVVPAIIMQNLKTVLFDSEHSPIKLGKLKSWLKPLRYINLVPSFSDQSGRGGLRGAIEIELNDRVHGLIQKNFSLSEDTKFEVEYALSDDVSLRAIRNERKDVGGEVEMRWKFGG